MHKFKKKFHRQFYLVVILPQIVGKHYYLLLNFNKLNKNCFQLLIFVFLNDYNYF